MAMITHQDLWSRMELWGVSVRTALGRRGPRVMDAQIERSLADDSLILWVKHKLFERHEILDGSFKQNFRSRMDAAILADKTPYGVELRRERRAFLARAQRAAKRKPKPKTEK